MHRHIQHVHRHEAISELVMDGHRQVWRWCRVADLLLPDLVLLGDSDRGGESSEDSTSVATMLVER